MSGILAALAGIKTAIATAVDEYFNRVTLLLNTSSTNGAQNNTFLDSSTNNFTITRNGNTTQGTFTPFSQTGWSNYTASGYLTTAANAGFALSGDFTVEAWVYSNDSSLDGTTRRRIFHTGGGDIANALQLVLGTSGGNSAVISVLSNSFLIDGTINVVTNSWVHVAVTRSGTSLRLFVNGVQSGSTATTSQNFNSGTSNTVYIGANSSGAGLWQGYISNLRVLVGTAAYTSGFTPPTASFATGTTNQQLLVCASNGFSDINTATTAKVITVNSTPSVQAFSPFLPTAAYDTAVVGGSGYFDGTGDYLTAPSNAAWTFGTNNITLESWVYFTSVAAVTFLNTSGVTSGFYWQYNTSQLQFGRAGGGTNIASSWSPSANTWYHIAVVRNGNTVTHYVNGVSIGSGAFTDNISATTTLQVGTGGAGSLTGYMSGTRIVNGTAVYTTNFTPPTAPPTAITNTQLLLNFINAGIYDSASKNVLETVGNAQVSTTQAKWGTTSMYFDGTGDALNFRSNDILSFQTGDWTIEFWVYHVSTTGQQTYIGDTPGNSNGPYIYKDTSHKIGLYYSAQILTATNAISATTWYHVAIARASGTVRLFINGTQEATASDSTTLSVPIQWVGADGTSNYFNGYIDDLRITKGYARYTANFTAPTAAFPTQ